MLTLGRHRQSLSRTNVAGRAIYAVAHRAWGWIVLARDVTNSDVFVFMFGQTYTNSRFELFLLKAFRKRLIFIYAGSDARPRYIDCLEDPVTDPRGVRALARKTRAQKRRVRQQESHALWCISAVTTAHFLTKPYIDALYFGLPRSIPESRTSTAATCTRDRVIRILHSPSSPIIKGTPLITNAIANLSTKGKQLEFVTIHNQPNSTVKRELARCDFVVDQTYSDLPWSGFVTEAAIYGKPAVIAGYAGDLYRRQVPPEDLPPSLYVLPEDLEIAIDHMASDHEFREGLGMEAKRFAERWAPEEVAQRLLRLCRNDADPRWIRSPADTSYVEGCGHARGKARTQVRALLQSEGLEALQLTDKPALEQEFVMFAAPERGTVREIQK